MSFYQQLEKFKASMRQAQVGVSEDKRAYQKVVGQANGVPLLGPYAIRSDEWADLSAAAGIEGARWQDRGAQEAVMSHQLTRLYNKFDGKWDGVALAWKAGEDVAQRVVIEGEPIASVIKGSGADTLQLYVNDVIQPIQDEEPGPTDFASAATYNGPFANASLVSEAPQQTRKRRDPGEVVSGRLTQMRNNQMKQKEVGTDGTTEEREPGISGNGPTEPAQGSGV